MKTLGIRDGSRRATRLLAAGAVMTSLALTGAGCSSDDSEEAAKVDSANHFVDEVLVANKESYGGKFREPEMVNAWGIAIRPAGAGGHFWVGAGGDSFEYVGDVRKSADAKLQTLHQDDLKEVAVPGADSLTDPETTKGKATGVVFNGADLNSDKFRVTTQTAQNNGADVAFDGSARFIFGADSGVISAWTERSTTGQVVRVDGPAATMFDGSSQGMGFFGVAINDKDWNTLWAADFGENPQIRQFDSKWNLVPTQGFVNPFATGDPIEPANAALGKKAKPGDPVPWNIQVLNGKAYVAYAVSKPGEEDATKFDVGEEDSLDADAERKADGKPNKGKVVEFNLDGSLSRVFSDDSRLNAPWGFAIAPQSWGKFAGALLVGNFGGLGHIAAYDSKTGTFIDYLRDGDGKPEAIEGLWGIIFGNGASLGDADALYYAAGPKEEVDGVFGVLRKQ